MLVIIVSALRAVGQLDRSDHIGKKRFEELKENQMKLKLFKDLINEQEVLAHVFMLCVPAEHLDEILKDSRESESESAQRATEVDLELTINGIPVDIERFFNQLYEKYQDLVMAHATKMVTTQTSDQFKRMAEQLKDFSNITEMWASMIKWNTKNQFDANANGNK